MSGAPDEQDDALLQLADRRLRAQTADEEILALIHVCGRLGELRRAPTVAWPEPRRAAVREFVLACRVATFDFSLPPDSPSPVTDPCIDAIPAAAVSGKRPAELLELAEQLRSVCGKMRQRAEWMEDSDARLNAIAYRRAARHLLAATEALELPC